MTTAAILAIHNHAITPGNGGPVAAWNAAAIRWFTIASTASGTGGSTNGITGTDATNTFTMSNAKLILRT